MLYCNWSSLIFSVQVPSNSAKKCAGTTSGGKGCTTEEAGGVEAAV
jgi:hypothetical protein